MASTAPSAPQCCPHCGSTDVEPTEPGFWANLLFCVSMLFMMSQINKGALTRCRNCGKTFRSRSRTS